MLTPPLQPATAFWRSIEIQAVLKAGLPPGRGLDIGCGDGLVTGLILRTEGPRDLVGVDPDPQEASLAVASGIYKAVHTCSADAIPEPDGSFDFVLANSVLEHIPDIEPVLAEASRVTRRSGRFLITAPSSDFHAVIRGPLIPASRSRYLEDLDQRLAHVHYWSADQWRLALGKVGFEVIETFGYLGRAQLRRWESIVRMTSGLLHKLLPGHGRPIEIQRRLGLRSSGRGMPPAAASAMARLLAAGVGLQLDPGDAGPHGAVLVSAVKR